MEQRKSILAAAMLAAFGLGTAAHIVHSGGSEAVPQHGQAPALNAHAPISAIAWADPPAHSSALSALSNAVVTTAEAAEALKPETAGADEPRTTQAMRSTALVRKAAIARLKAHRAQVSAERLWKAEALWRRRIAQRRMRVFQASMTRRVQTAPELVEQMPPPAPAPKAAVQSDPIHILIHGLGLDG